MKKEELCELFRRNLRAFREELGLSQSELARRMNCAPSYICDLENSRRMGVTLGTVALIAEHLGVSPSALISTIRTPHGVPSKKILQKA